MTFDSCSLWLCFDRWFNLESLIYCFTYSFRIVPVSTLSSFSCLLPSSCLCLRVLFRTCGHVIFSQAVFTPYMRECYHVSWTCTHCVWILRMGVVGGPFLELAHMPDATQWMVWGRGGCYRSLNLHTRWIRMQWMWWAGADVKGPWPCSQSMLRSGWGGVWEGSDPWTCRHGGCYVVTQWMVWGGGMQMFLDVVTW